MRLPWESPLFAKVAARGTGGRAALPRDWVWPTVLAFVIAAAGAAAAIAVTRDESSGAAAISTAIGGNPLAADTATLPVAPEQTAGISTVAPPRTTTAPVTTNPNALMQWPRGLDGWTIVLVSMPQRNGSKPAREKAQEAVKRGLRQVGIIDSSRFPSLHAGYYVVFTGVYDSAEEAAGALRQAKAVFRTAYTREIAA
jgi:hypothetical protein